MMKAAMVEKATLAGVLFSRHLRSLFLYLAEYPMGWSVFGSDLVLCRQDRWTFRNFDFATGSAAGRFSGNYGYEY